MSVFLCVGLRIGMCIYYMGMYMHVHMHMYVCVGMYQCEK